MANNKLYWHKIWLILGLIQIETALLFHFIFSAKIFGYPHEDWLYHGLSFLLPMFWMAMLFKSRKEQYYLFVTGLLLGAILEGLQKLTPYHIFDWADIAANWTGLIIGLKLANTPAGKLLRLIERQLRAIKPAT